MFILLDLMRLESEPQAKIQNLNMVEDGHSEDIGLVKRFQEPSQPVQVNFSWKQVPEKAEEE